MRLVLMVLLALGSFAQSPRESLLSELRGQGITSRQPVELALIVAGVEEDQLAGAQAKVDGLVDGLVAEVDTGKSSRKMAKQLFIQLLKQTKTFSAWSYDLRDLTERGMYSTATAALIYAEAAQRLGLDVQVGESPVHIFAELTDGKRTSHIEFLDRGGFDREVHDYQMFARTMLEERAVTEQELANILIQERFDAYMQERVGISNRQLVAVLCSMRAYKREPDAIAEQALDLELSAALAPESWYGEGNLDRELHARINKLYQEKNAELGLRLAIAAAHRFPDYKDYAPFLFNFAILRIQALDAKQEFERGFEVVRQVKPLLEGEMSAQFDQIFPTLHLNYAVHLFGQQDFEGAESHALQAKSAFEELRQALSQVAGAQAKLSEIDGSMATIADLLPKAKAGQVQQYLTSGDKIKANQALAELQELDPARAEEIKTQLGQQQLQALFESGNYADALKVAATQLDKENGKQNYLATLNGYANELISAKQFQSALDTLSQVPQQVAQDKLINDLRYNVYIAWLNSLKSGSHEEQLKVYDRLFADKAMTLTQEEGDALRNNHVAVLAARVENAIAKGTYDKAGRLLAEAEAIYPDQAGLKSLRNKIETIKARLRQ